MVKTNYAVFVSFQNLLLWSEEYFAFQLLCLLKHNDIRCQNWRFCGSNDPKEILESICRMVQSFWSNLQETPLQKTYVHCLKIQEKRQGLFQRELLYSFLEIMMSLFASIGAFVSLLLTSDTKNSRCIWFWDNTGLNSRESCLYHWLPIQKVCALMV